MSATAATAAGVTTEHGVASDVLSKGRDKCYKARDAFYACVDVNKGKTTPTELGAAGLLFPSACIKDRKAYTQCCRSTWVSHFDRLYGAKKQLSAILSQRETGQGQ